jgi:CPA1 family monovalent cation:H+ antiporter
VTAAPVSGQPFPERATIQAVAFVVSVGTLLVQGWTLPLLIRRLHLSRFSDDYAADREEELKAERVVHDAADEVLAQFRADPPQGMDPRVLAEIRAGIRRTPTKCPIPMRTRSDPKCSRLYIVTSWPRSGRR